MHRFVYVNSYFPPLFFPFLSSILSAERSEEASKALAAKREYQERIEQIAKDFDEEKQQTYEITQDMTRQYKGMQEELLTRINKLEQTIQELNDRLAEADIRQERVLKDKASIIQMKDDEIAELKAKMDDMAEEFGEMLRETLEKMRERIEISSNNYEGPDLHIQHKMEELKLDPWTIHIQMQIYKPITYSVPVVFVL